MSLEDYTPPHTPVEKCGEFWLKRDDLFCIAGVRGGKVRSCWALAQGAPGLVTACSRHSPQGSIVAHVAKRLGIPARVHTAKGPPTSEMFAAREAGAVIIEHRPGYNSVIISRAAEDAEKCGYREIPFGMRCQEAVRQTSEQVQNLPRRYAIRRIVVPVGSGITLAGVLWGIYTYRQDLAAVPIIGVTVGSDPRKTLDSLAIFGWRSQAKLVPAEVGYHDAVDGSIGGAKLDSHYEAKCLPFLKPGDLFWLVGIRSSEAN